MLNRTRSLRFVALFLFIVISVFAVTAQNLAERIELKNTAPSEPKTEEGLIASGELVGQLDSPEVASNYAFVTGTTGSLTDMSSGTTTLVAANLDDTASALTNIGFDFYFQGIRYTQFSVNENGVLRLGAAAQAGSPYKPLAQAALPIITAYGADQRVHTSGKVHFKVTGATGSRVLIIEWLNNQSNFNSGGTADLTYQVLLYETTGVIEFVYGSMTMSTLGAADTNSRDPNIGFSSNSTAGTVGSVTAPQSGTPAPTFNGASATPVANLYTAGAITTLTSAAQGSRRSFTFTPPVPTAPTGLSFTAVGSTSMTLNWTDSPDETLYAIFNSTDGTNYNFVNTAAQNATSIAVSGLAVNTNYFWRVFALSEGALSGALSGTQATTPAGNITCNGAGGLWSSAGSWTGGVPTAGDNATIGVGCTITIDTAATALNIVVQSGGILQFEQTTARTLTVPLNVTIDSGGTFRSNTAGTQTGHILSLAGNLTNNGTLDFSTNADTAGAGITFTGATNNTFSGTGATTDVRTITINKGTSNANILEISTSTFTVRGATTDSTTANYLTLTNGTYKISGAFTANLRTVTGPSYTIGSTSGIWLNNPNYTVTAQGGTVTMNGLFRVSQGTYNVGTGAGNSLNATGTGSTVTIEGGILNVASRLTNGTNTVYNQSGGTANLCNVSNTSGSFASFDGLASATLNMSGGAINLVQAATSLDWWVDGTVNVTGSGTTVTAGTAATVTAFNFRMRGNVPNLVVDNTTNNKTVTAIAQINLRGGTTINTGATMVINGFSCLILGPTFTNNGTLTGTAASTRFYFLGGLGATVYSGTGVVTAPLLAFEVDNTAGVTIAPGTTNNIVAARFNNFSGGLTGSGKLTLGNGAATTAAVQLGVTGVTLAVTGFDVPPVFNPGTGGVNLFYAPELTGRTTGNEMPPSRTLTTLAITNPNNITIAGGDVTVNGAGAGALALGDSRVITGANTLYFNSAAGTVTRTTGRVDGNFKKSYAGAGSKNFEVGTANGYSPVTINATTGTFPADITVRAVQSAQPNMGDPTKALSRYWALTGTGVTADLTFNYLDPTDIPVTATEGNFVIAKYSGGFTQPGGTVNTAANTATITGVTSFSDWTLAELTGIDATPPTVTTVAPLNGATGVSVNTTVTINFSENVNIGGGGMTLNCGGAIAFTTGSTTNVNTLVLTPTAPLPNGTLCTVTAVAANIADLATNNMAANFVWTFTTASGAAPVTVPGTAGPDTLVITATSVNGGSYVLNGGAPVPIVLATNFTFNGLGGDDTFTINNPAGGLFAPSGGIDYNGGGQPGDNMNLFGGGGAGYNETYFVGTTTPPIGAGPGNAGDGLIRFTGPNPVDIRFTGLAPIVDTVAAGSLTVNSTDAADVIQLVNGAVAPRLRVSVGAFEPIDFDNKTNLIVNGGDGTALGDAGDTVTINYSNTPAALNGVFINGNEGNDNITVLARSGAYGLTLNGNENNDQLNASAVSAGPGSIALNGGDGDDALSGSGGNDVMDGGQGDDTFIGNGGTDNTGGGAGASVFDQLLAPGTAGGDTMTFALNGSQHLLVTVNGVTTTYANFVGGPFSGSGMEEVLVSAGTGNDSITSSVTPLNYNFRFNGDDNDDTINASATVAGGNQIFFNGNNGNDTLIGGGDDDIFDGGAGDDTLIGNGGTDAAGGGAGADGPNGDSIILSGTAAADTMSLSVNGSTHLVATAGVTTTYTNFIGGSIDSSGIEQVNVNADASNDTINVQPTNVQKINIDGGSPAPPTFPGDALTVNTAGATGQVVTPGAPGAGVITFTNRAQVSYVSIEAPPFAPTACGTGATWTNKAVYPLSVYGAATASDGTNAYTFGGYTTTGGISRDQATRYNTATDTWTPLAPMPTGTDYVLRADYGGNGKIYVTGGVTNGTLNRIYDIGTNSWSAGAPIPAAVYDHGHAYSNGKIYTIGGIISSAATSIVRAYDIAGNSWSTLAPLPTPLFNQACGTTGGKIYCAGGSPNSVQVADLYIYDIAGNSWSSGPPMGTAANSPAGTIVGGNLWVIGGGNPNRMVDGIDPKDAEPTEAPDSLSVTQIYDPVANAWQTGPSLNLARSFAEAVTLNAPGGQMPIIVGGFNSGAAASTDTVEALQSNCPSPTTQVLYAANGSGGASTLYTLNPATGAIASTIGPIGFSITGLAVDPTTGILYASEGRDATSDPKLLTINTTTGAGTVVGSFNLSGQTAADLAFNSAGVLYGFIESTDDDIATINKATGQATIVGDAGFGAARSSLEFDSSGTLYYLGLDLRTINPATGAVTSVVPSSLGNVGLGLTFDSAGTMFAIQRIGGGTGGARALATVNKTTGVGTVVGPSVPGLDAIAFGGSAATTPIVTAPANQTANEGANTSFNLGSFADPDGGPWTVTVNWGDGSPNTVIAAGVAGTLGSANHIFADDNPTGTASDPYTVTVTVTDSGSLSGNASFTTTVSNVAPSAINRSFTGVVNENGVVTLNASFVDPGTLDTHAVTIDWGDGSAVQTINLLAGVLAIPATTHTYLDDNPTGTSSDQYIITVGVTDDDTGSATPVIGGVTVNNVAPSAVTLNLSATTINEGGSTSLSGSFTDPGTQDTHSVVINWGDGSTNTTIPLTAGVLTIPSTAHTYLDDNPTGTAGDPYTITVTVTDDDTGTASNTTTVTVNNVAPSAIILSRTPTTINEGQSTALSGSFTDPGTQDTHTVTINWGDGSTNTTIPLTAGVLTIPSTNHTYLDDNPVGTPSDVYTITVTVADDDLGSARSTDRIIADLTDKDAAILAERLRTQSSVKAPSIPDALKIEMPQLSELQPLAPCTNTFAFGSATINTAGTVTQVSSCSFGGDYSTISGAVSGQVLNFTMSAPGASNEITIRSGTPSGPVVASGTTPLSFTNTFTGTLYAHWNLTACGTDVSCHTTTVQCTGNCTGAAPTTTTVTVNNVAPTATFSNGGPYVVGQPGTVSFSGQADPSASDLAGLRYSYDLNNDGTFDIGNGTYAGSVAATSAVFPAQALPGAYTVRGRVIDDDTGFTDYTTVVTVGKANTTTTVTAAPATSVFGQSVTFTATVAVVAPGVGTPTGTVSFNIDGNIYCANTPLSGALTATCTQAGLPALPAGVRNVVAVYSGNVSFNGSAGTLNYTVTKANTTTTITSIAPEPSLVNQPYAVTWTVTAVAPGAGTPTGTVTINGGTGGGTCTAAVAAGGCSLTPTTIGVKVISATYNGDANFNTSTSATANHTVNVGISGTVRNGLTLAPISGVTIALYQMPGGTFITSTTTNAAGLYTFAGQYTGPLAVQPTVLNPPYYDPQFRNIPSTATNVTGQDFLSYATVPDIPRVLSMTTQYVVPGQAGSMPFILNSQGNETFVSFSISYDINPFSQPPVFVCGADAPGCTITNNTSVLGRVGVTITPAGGSFARDGEEPNAPGLKEIARMNFLTVPTPVISSTPITFVSGGPVAFSMLDAANNPLLTVTSSRSVVFVIGIEGDVATRNAGSGALDSGDIVQTRRFVTGLDSAFVNTFNEFQRTDTAPASSKGDGFLDATDLVQTRRYIANLDAPQSAGGVGFPNPTVRMAPESKAIAPGEISAGSAQATNDTRVSVPVSMRSTGTETAVSFAVRYNEARLTTPTVTLADGAPDGAILTVNTSEPGIIRILIDSTNVFKATDLASLVNITFDVTADAPSGNALIEIEDLVFSDAEARSTTSKATSGIISIAGANAAEADKPAKVRDQERSATRKVTLPDNELIQEWLNKSTIVLKRPID